MYRAIKVPVQSFLAQW